MATTSATAEDAKRRGRVDTTVESLEEDVEHHDTRITRLERFTLLATGYLVRDANLDIIDIISTVL